MTTAAEAAEAPQRTDEYDTLLLHFEPPIGIIEFNRPERHNTINPETSERDMDDAFKKLHADPSISVVILTGKRSFCAGADLKEPHRNVEVHGDSNEEEAFARRLVFEYDYGNVWRTMMAFQKPIIGAICGYAIGGGLDMALKCDLLVAAEDTIFANAQIDVGHVTGYAPNALAKIVGKVRAMDLILNGRRFSAQEALEMGVVNKVVPNDQLMAEARAMALEVASKPPLAVALAKKIITRACSYEEDWDLGRAYMYFLKQTDDTKEAWRAKAEKRSPAPFRGR